MKIAIIGWGSLIWDPRKLPREGTWQDDGPELPIEFSRISRDGRLTLVIDETHGTSIKTKHVLSPRTSLRDARDDLRRREGTSDKNIGWVGVIRGTDSRNDSPGRADVHAVEQWCRDKEYDGAVWTTLESNFEKETNTPFSVEACLDYLRHLPRNVRREALRYIRNAPKCVDTPVRQRIEEEFGLLEAPYLS